MTGLDGTTGLCFAIPTAAKPTGCRRHQFGTPKPKFPRNRCAHRPPSTARSSPRKVSQIWNAGAYFRGKLFAVRGSELVMGRVSVAWNKNRTRLLSCRQKDRLCRPASRPIPLWVLYPEWGWGTHDSAQALSYLKRFGSVTVLNKHISSDHAESGRKRQFPHSHGYCIPAARPRECSFIRYAAVVREFSRSE